jgi:hypothetical protein
MGLTFVDAKPEAAPQEQEQEPERWKTRWLSRSLLNWQCATCGYQRNVEPGGEILGPHCFDYASREEADAEAHKMIVYYNGTSANDTRYLGAIRVD